MEEDSMMENKKLGDDVTWEIPTEEIRDVIPEFDETRCGFGDCKPNWMRNLAQPQVFLLISTLMYWCQNTFNSYSRGNITTIERRFKLSSQTTGFIMMGRDLVQIFLAIPLTQIAGKTHRPRWMAFGMSLVLISCLLSALPHFLFGADSYDVWTTDQENLNIDVNQSTSSEGSEGLCEPENVVNETWNCEENVTRNNVEATVVIILQFLAQILFGIPFIMSFTISYTYLDESVKKDKSPLFFALSGAFRVIGPLTGAMLSSWALSIWVEPHLTPFISKEHPQWIGAWWIGYPIIAIQYLLPLIGMLLLPKMLPGTRKRMIRELKTLYQKNREEFLAVKDKFRSKNSVSEDFLPSLRRIMTNKIFVVLTFHQAVFWSTATGLVVFTPKYMENAFKISASQAVKYNGMIGLVSSTLGWITMGSFMTYLKPRTKVTLQIVASMSVILAISYFTMMYISCDSPPVEGLEFSVRLQNMEQAMDRAQNYNDMETCMLDCNCMTVYAPVCVEYEDESYEPSNEPSSQNFINPCYAGCQKKSEANITTYSSCTCAQKLHPNSTVMSASDGLCSDKCQMLTFYLVLVGIVQYLIATNRAVRNIIFFRCVQEKDKDLSLGILGVVISIVVTGYLPVIGHIIDSCCDLWQKTCGTYGYCYVYDIDQFRQMHHLLPGVGMVICSVCDLLLLKWHRSLDLLGRNAEELLSQQKKVESTEENAQ